MSRVSKYENIVHSILLDKVATRSDDKLLYYWVLSEEGFNVNVSLYRYLLNGDNFPNYDSITRCRRKLQAKYPELRPAKNEQIRREEAEQDFRAYARGEE